MILDKDGNPIKSSSEISEYMFAIEGQIYEIGDMPLFDDDLEDKMKIELVEDTTLQIAFMEALKSIMNYWHDRPGLHPNVKNLTIFDDDDQIRVDAMNKTLKYFKEKEKPIVSKFDVDNLKMIASNKMFDTIVDIPDAWTEDGKIKPGFVKDHMANMAEMAKLDLGN